jgi:hypothetical protein
MQQQQVAYRVAGYFAEEERGSSVVPRALPDGPRLFVEEEVEILHVIAYQ